VREFMEREREAVGESAAMKDVAFR
jgi:hypothetical protein